jgi:methylated-DNA-protein-cysteine methyltransferase-like protein
MADDNFFERVYEVARLIPVGRVTSYGAIANYLGTKGSSRMVGWAMQACGRAFPPVPAHRVVNRQGLLTAKFHFGGERMQQMLESEGVKVEDDQVQDFKNLFWDPSVELAL